MLNFIKVWPILNKYQLVFRWHGENPIQQDILEPIKGHASGHESLMLGEGLLGWNNNVLKAEMGILNDAPKTCL